MNIIKEGVRAKNQKADIDVVVVFADCRGW